MYFLPVIMTTEKVLQITWLDSNHSDASISDAAIQYDWTRLMYAEGHESVYKVLTINA